MGNAQELLDEAFRRQESGKPDEAIPFYERVLRIDPGHAGALYHLGTIELSRSNVAAGVEWLRQAASRSPGSVEIQHSLGGAYKRLKEWGNAALAFERALAIEPDFAPAFFELGDLSQTLGQVDAAVAFYQRAINLAPAHTEAFRRLGELLFARGNWIGAENCFQRVLDAGLLDGKPDELTAVLNRLGIALVRQEKLDQAAAVFTRILDIDPSVAEMHSNLSFVYERLGRLDDALAAGQRAVAMKPAYAEGHNNLGVACRALHRLDDARRSFTQALAIQPDFALAQFNLGALELLEGHYAEGWPGYEWRNHTRAGSPRTFPVPRWDGRPIPGRRLLVHAEQGYGDTLQFARFIEKAREKSGAEVVLEGPAALLPLLRGIAGADEVLRAGTALPAVDAEIPLPSLPGVLGIEMTDLPGSVPYLHAPEAASRTWRERLALCAAEQSAAEPGFLKIGFVWMGNPAQQQDVVRSCPLACFAALAAVPGMAWYSLQKEAGQAILDSAWPADRSIVALGPQMTDFADTAAVIGELDLVISVDTAVAHLAGALGRPIWTLLPHTPDWRWQLDWADSPWYPTMRLFRQPRWGDWKAVFGDVAAALRDLVSARRPG